MMSLRSLRNLRKKKGSRSFKVSDIVLNQGERIDDLQIKGYQIIQNSDGFCFGMDAVLLSDYAKIKKNAVVMDLCSGTGIVPILLEAKYPVLYVEGLEYQAQCVEMANRSIALNHQKEKIHFTRGDVKEVKSHYKSNSYDYVTCNPPYMTNTHGLINDDYGKAIARHEMLCTLEDVLSAAKWLLKPAGHFVMVHRPFRLAEIMYQLKEYKLEPKRMRIVYPYVDKEPNMVLIDAVKGGKQRITVDPPLIVYHRDGSYTDEIYKIYGE